MHAAVAALLRRPDPRTPLSAAEARELLALTPEHTLDLLAAARLAASTAGRVPFTCGIVNAKSSGQNAEGLGFAIPVNTAIQVAEELINNGYVTGRPAMGVTVLSINDAQTAFQYGVNQAGVYVQSVNEGGAADKAGLQPGDRFVSIDGTAVNSTSDITGIIGEHAVGDTIEVQVVRGTQIVTANVTLEESTPQASSTQRTEG